MKQNEYQIIPRNVTWVQIFFHFWYRAEQIECFQVKSSSAAVTFELPDLNVMNQLEHK